MRLKIIDFLDRDFLCIRSYFHYLFFLDFGETIVLFLNVNLCFSFDSTHYSLVDICKCKQVTFYNLNSNEEKNFFIFFFFNSMETETLLDVMVGDQTIVYGGYYIQIKASKLMLFSSVMSLKKKYLKDNFCLFLRWFNLHTHTKQKEKKKN